MRTFVDPFRKGMGPKQWPALFPPLTITLDIDHGPVYVGYPPSAEHPNVPVK